MFIEVPNIAPITNSISLALHTGGLKGRKPLSMLVCAPPDSGKTRAMEQFHDGRAILRINFATRSGLIQLLDEDQRWKIVHHIILSDYTASMAGNNVVGEGLRDLLLPLLYDGVTGYHTHLIRKLHLPPGATILVGMIAGIVPSLLKRRTVDWSEGGLLRRFLPLSYKYTPKQIEGIKLLSLAGRNIKPPAIRLNREVWGQQISVDERKTRSLLTLVTGGPTATEHWHNMILAHALRRGSIVAEDQDIAAIIRLSEYWNFDMHELKSQILELPD